MSDAYRKSGVDVDAGYDAVARIKKHAMKTMPPNALGGLGGFGGLYSLAGHLDGMREPVLVAGADGVGTKLEIAFRTGRHDTIGIDAVAMCANDVVTSGARPLFFLDYIACGKVVPEKIEAIVKGISDGCLMAGCALLGGETAEHPGMMPEDEYDVAGFCVGIAERDGLVSGGAIEEGDAVIGLPSSGVHSNGFSLIRKLIRECGLDLGATYPPLCRPLCDELLVPTKIYAKPVLELCRRLPPKGMAHITGGGFVENLPRILPGGLSAAVDPDAWERPPVFDFIRERAGISEAEMFGIYNMGIGMALVTAAGRADETIGILAAAGEKAAKIGSVRRGAPEVVFLGR